MRRVVLLTILATSVLHATSFTSASCTLGATTQTTTGRDSSTCSIPSIPPAVGTVQADAIASNSLSGTQATMVAATDAGISAEIPPAIQSSATSSASDSLTFSTAGPSRPGIIQFDIVLGYAHEDFGGASQALLSDGVHQYSFIGGGGIHGPIPPLNCFTESCEYKGTLPFELGTDFNVSASSLSPSLCCFGFRSADSSINFSLFEANGQTSVPFFVTPEPSTRTLVLFGLAASAFFTVKARRSPSRLPTFR